MPRGKRTGGLYRALRAQVLAEEDFCGECRLPVDKTLSGRLPWGPTVGHLIALVDGGPMLRANMQLEHLRCNVAKENRRRAQRRRSRAATPSREW